MVKKKTFWRTNNDIRALQLRVVGADGKQIGVLDRAKALAMARDLGVDLIETVPQANPPVAKIIDFGKFLYQEEKKQRKEQKKTKGTEVKEVRFSPFIAQNDYETRLARVKEFLSEKNKVRVVVVFKGRQLGSRSFGYNLLKRINNDLGEGAHIDMEAKFIGRHLTSVVSPTAGKKIDNAEIKNEKISN